MLNETNLNAFMARYANSLALDLVEHPEDYSWHGIEEFDRVVAKMRDAYARGATGGAWPNKSKNADRACRALGIKPTFKALGVFLTAEVRS